LCDLYPGYPECVNITRTSIAVALGLVLVGCGNQAQPTTTSPTPTNSGSSGGSATGQGADQGKVDFMDGVCGAVGKFLVPAVSFRPDTSSPAAAVASLKTQLGAMSNGLTEANSDLGKVDTSQVPDGKAAITDLQNVFGELKGTVDKTKTRLDSVDPNNQQAVAAAVQQAGQDLSGLASMKNPLDQPNLKSADMEAAAEKAPNCRQIKSTVAGRASGPPMTS